MPSYSNTYKRLAERAVMQGKMDIATFIDQMADAGTSLDRIEQMLLDDLSDGGPIFGKFFRAMTGAAQQTTLEASRQGATMADVQKVASSKSAPIVADFMRQAAEALTPAQFEQFQKDVDAERALIRAAEQAAENADPEEMARIEELGGRHLLMMWVAAMVNTCHLCLPLHGKVATLDEWREIGETPGQVHSTAGWSSPCYCKFVEVGHLTNEEFLERKNATKAPLVRNKLKDTHGIKGARRTARGVGQNDITKALQARDQALQSKEGRKTLRLLGQVGIGEG